MAKKRKLEAYATYGIGQLLIERSLERTASQALTDTRRACNPKIGEAIS